MLALAFAVPLGAGARPAGQSGAADGDADEGASAIPADRVAKSPLVVTRDGVYELHVRGGVADRRLDLWGLDAASQPLFLGRFPGPRVPRGAQYLGVYHVGQRIYLWHDLDTRGKGGRHVFDVADETAYHVLDTGNGGYEVNILDPATAGRVLLALVVSPRVEGALAAAGVTGARPAVPADIAEAMRGARAGSIEVAALGASPAPGAVAGPAAGPVAVSADTAGPSASARGWGTSSGWVTSWVLPGLVGLCFVGAVTMHRASRKRPEDMSSEELMAEADRYLRRGRSEKALKYLALLIEGGSGGPLHEVAKLRRGLHWLAGGDLVKAREDLLKVEAEHLGAVDLYTLGVALEQVDESAAAIAVFLRLSESHPGHADVALRLRRLGAVPSEDSGAVSQALPSPDGSLGLTDAPPEASGPASAGANPATDAEGAARRPSVGSASAGAQDASGTGAKPASGEGASAASAGVASAGAASAGAASAGGSGRGGILAGVLGAAQAALQGGTQAIVQAATRTHAQEITRAWAPAPARHPAEVSSRSGGTEYAQVSSARSGASDPALDAIVARAGAELTHVALVASTPLGYLFSARDRRSGQDVTLKVLAPALAQHADLRRQFLAEAVALMRVAHPAVVRVLSVLPDLPGFTHEPLEGETLEAALARAGRLPIRDVIAIGLRLAEGLDALHAGGVVHRDVRPGTVFLEGGRPRLLDLGMASAPISRLLGATGRPQRREPYCAPEDSDGRHVDARADIYSLGATLYEALTGQPPSGPRPPLATGLVPGAPPALELAIDRCMRLDPGERFLDCGQLREALIGLHQEWSSAVMLRTSLLVLLEKLLTAQLRPLARLLAPSEGGEAGPAGVSALFWHPTVKDDVRALVTGPSGLRVRMAQTLELARAVEAWMDKGVWAAVLARLEALSRGSTGLEQLLAPESPSRIPMDRSMAEAVGRLSHEIEPAIDAIETVLAAHEIDVGDVVARVTGRYSSLLRTDLSIEGKLCGRFPEPAKAAPAVEQAIDRLTEAAIERGAHHLEVRGDFLPGRARLRLELRDDGRPLPPRQFGEVEQPLYKLVEAARSLIQGLGGHSELAGVGKDGLTIRLVLPTHLV